MLSKQSLIFFTKKNKIIYKKYKKKPNLNSFIDLIKRGIVPRPHYALGLLFAAKQAKDLGYKSIKVLELPSTKLVRSTESRKSPEIDSLRIGFANAPLV